MSVPFPIDDYLDLPWYEGAQLPVPGPAFAEPFSPLRREDENRFWMLEGHWSRGLTPLTVSAGGDSIWGTQHAAHLFQLPPTKGQSGRLIGIHLYLSDHKCCSDWEVQHRARVVESLVGPAIADFPAIWESRLSQLKAGLEHFESADVSMLLQGRPTMIMQTDRQLWALAAAARQAGIAGLFDGRSAADTLTVLRSSDDPAVSGWVARFDEFLGEYGWRTEGFCDPSLAPWIEDPTPAVALVAGFLRAPQPHDFDAAEARALEQRDAAVARIHATLADQAAIDRFTVGLELCEHANFAWWQEEHNFYLDLRVHIPLRRAALRLGELVGATQFDDLVYLFRHELNDVARGRTDYETLRSTVVSRRQFYADGLAERDRMPPVLGTPDAGGDDPVLKEIFGVDARLIKIVTELDADTTELVGVPASSGTVVGRARVITTTDLLWELEDGEILVCGLTSPNWTPAFAQVAGCVADSGGALSHTAIVAREYGVPAVVGTAVATRVIRTGDLIEVDADAGKVRIIERA